MKTFDASEMQVRLNECGEGEYCRREVAEELAKELNLAAGALEALGYPNTASDFYDAIARITG